MAGMLTWPPWDLPAGTAPIRPRGVEHALARALPVDRGGPFVAVFEDAARAESGRGGAEDARPLAGTTVAIKDIIAVAGSPLGAGTAQRRHAPPEPRDAAIVSRLRGLGAIPVGLAALHEIAFGVTGVNPTTGSPPNPVDPTRVPGGSSSGSAVAVATGAADFALGTDTGGSIRIPAALCGVVGFKPGYGEYPLDRVFPLAPSLDHVGLLASSTVTIRRVHEALGHAPGRVALPRRVGVLDEEIDAADPEVRMRVRSVLDALADGGARVEPVRWPSVDRSFAASTAILFSEAAAVHRAAFEADPDGFTAETRRRLEAGLRIDAPTYVTAKAEQAQLRSEVMEVLDQVDVVMGPSVPVLAPPLERAHDPDVAARLVASTRLLNVVGAAAVSLPAPGSGLPAGVQVVARSSPAALGASAAIEAALAAAR